MTSFPIIVFIFFIQSYHTKMHASASENLPYKKRKENRQSQEVSFANFINLFRFSFDNIPSHFLNLLSSLGSFLPIDYLCNVIKSAPFTSLQDSGDFRSQTSIIASSDDNLSDCTECSTTTTILEPGSPSPPPSSLPVIAPFMIKQETEEPQDKKGDTEDTSHAVPPRMPALTSTSSERGREVRLRT